MKKIFVLCFALLSLGAQAVEWSKASDFAWDVGTGKITTFPGQGSGNMWKAGELKANPLGPTVERMKALPFNPSPTANFKATFTPKAIAKAVLSPTSAVINLALYVGINALLDGACSRVMGGSMSLASGGQWEECKTKTVLAEQFCTADPRKCASSPEGAISAWVGVKNFGVDTSQPYYAKYEAGVCQKTPELWCDFKRTSYAWGVPTVGGGREYLQRSSTSTEVPDGWKPSTPAAIAPKLEAALDTMSQADFSNGYHGVSGQAGHVVDDLIESGNGIEPDITVSGPASQPVSSSQTVDTVNNTTTTTTINNTYNYAKQSPLASTVTNTQNSSVVTINNTTGAVTNNSNTTQTGKDVEVCGLPGKPACKMDETGTQTTFDPNTYKPKSDALKAEQDTRRETISGKADKPFFQGWEIFFSAPAVVQCVPFVLPRDYGELNPCPVVDGVRLVMGYLWAFGALVLCLGMIKRSF